MTNCFFTKIELESKSHLANSGLSDFSALYIHQHLCTYLDMYIHKHNTQLNSAIKNKNCMLILCKKTCIIL